MVTEADAFIDESGHRSTSAKSSDHFVLSAVLVRRNRLPDAATLLAELRRALKRGPNDEISWKKIKSHPDRLKAAQMLGKSPIIGVSSVIVCKRDFGPGQGTMPTQDFAYLYTFRFLLERLSWLARDASMSLSYTLAQIGQFSVPQLRKYESILKTLPECSVHWGALDPSGGKIDQPSRLEYLQLADIAASATAQAFEPDRHGNTEQHYLEELRPCIYRYGSKANRYTSYGLKMHPWNDGSKSAHPWLTKW